MIAFYLKIWQESPSASWLLAELATHMNKILRDLLGSSINIANNKYIIKNN
jgi:hypothetical protein